jgi:malate dehydrogenase (oxaloacetate-decarboxylating)(NADP+)
VVIQFEDFASHNAFRLLRKYRDRIPTFNDDIQGTAAVTLAGILSAQRITGSALKEQTLLFQGAGEAATGIADLAVEAMVAKGLTKTQARGRCWLFDSQGLVVSQRSDLAEHKRPYAHDHAPVGTLLDAVKALRPTAIIGVAAVGGAFTEDVVRTMALLNKRPIVFALSNPTSKSECTATQAYRWSDGRALFACGSPFDPVTLDGRTHVPRQGNNSYIFPGVGLGVIVSGASRVTDEMFMAAANELAAQVRDEDLRKGSVYPPLSSIREVSAHIAAATAAVAYRSGLARGAQPANLLEAVRSMYEPATAITPENDDDALRPKLTRRAERYRDEGHRCGLSRHHPWRNESRHEKLATLATETASTASDSPGGTSA